MHTPLTAYRQTAYRFLLTALPWYYSLANGHHARDRSPALGIDGLERELVPDPRSFCSTSTVRSPRMAASRATPAPVMPPPITSTSAGCAVSWSIVARSEDRAP